MLDDDHEDNDDSSLAEQNRRRWRFALTAIYCTRVLVSLSKKLLQTNTGLFLRSPSYVAIDVSPEEEITAEEDEDHLPLFNNIDPKKLTDMVKGKDFEWVDQFGGVRALASVLETDEKDGVSGSNADLTHRANVFGTNKYKKPPSKTFVSFVVKAFKDTTIIILLVWAILSLGFGIKQHGAKEGWYDGGSIVFAIFLVVVVVSAGSNYKQSRQFEKLSSESSDIKVEVVRDGQRRKVSIFDVVVGDIPWLKIGDQVPADGLFLDGQSLKVDESSMTGESDHVDVNEKTPFLLSGTKVTDGYGTMLVTSVGMNTMWGEMMSSISRDSDEQTISSIAKQHPTSSLTNVNDPPVRKEDVS